MVDHNGSQWDVVAVSAIAAVLDSPWGFTLRLLVVSPTADCPRLSRVN